MASASFSNLGMQIQLFVLSFKLKTTVCELKKQCALKIRALFFYLNKAYSILFIYHMHYQFGFCIIEGLLLISPWGIGK
jgi:hypothetical protein